MGRALHAIFATAMDLRACLYTRGYSFDSAYGNRDARFGEKKKGGKPYGIMEQPRSEVYARQFIA